MMFVRRVEENVLAAIFIAFEKFDNFGKLSVSSELRTGRDARFSGFLLETAA